MPVLATGIRILSYFSLRLLSFQLLLACPDNYSVSDMSPLNRLSVQGTLYPQYSSLPGIHMAPKEIASCTFAWLGSWKRFFCLWCYNRKYVTPSALLSTVWGYSLNSVARCAGANQSIHFWIYSLSLTLSGLSLRLFFQLYPGSGVFHLALLLKKKSASTYL